MDWVLRRLADRMGVKPPQAGEAIVPQIRFEQPWGQGTLLLLVLACGALIIWLYRREGAAPTWYKMLLAGLRISLVLVAAFMMSEAVLSVERTGLPYMIVMADDSASGGVVDQYSDPKARRAAEDLAKAAGKSEPNRLAIAQGWLARDNSAMLRTLQKQHKVKLYLVSSTARPLAEVDQPEQIETALADLLKARPTGDQTRLGDGVRQVLTELRGVPPTAILLLTDGQTTDGEGLAPAAELARRKGVPLYTIGLGDPEPARDLELTDLVVDDVVFVDDLVRFEAKLLSQGFAGQPIQVSLKQLPTGSKNPKLGKVIESLQVQGPPDGQPRRIELRHRPKETGDITFVLEVETKPRELQVENNRIVRTINVRQEKLKVLLVDGDPRYEYRYVKNLLERDPTIDLKVVLQSADPEYSEQEKFALPTMPTAKDGPEGLNRFDVVILGDADPAFLSATQMQNLVEFVTQKGGGLLFVAGENFNPLRYKGSVLEPLLPIQLAEARNPSASGTPTPGFKPALTAEGRNHPIFRFGDDEASNQRIWQRLPDLYWVLEAPRKAPAAFVLAEHPQLNGSDGKLPVILYKFVGSGKVMLNAVDDTWRWRFRVGDNGPFGRFWIQTIRFLARSKLLGQKQAEITTDRRRYARGQPVQIQVRFTNPGVTPKSGEVAVQVDQKGKGTRRLSLKAARGSPNIFEAALPGLIEGEYDVRLLPPPTLPGGMPTANFRIDPPAGEFERVQMNEPELRRAAEASSGKFYTPVTLSGLLKDLPPPQKVPLDTDPPIPLWNTWPLLALFLGILTAEWVLRKRKQMV
jgi:hypothetical protein